MIEACGRLCQLFGLPRSTGQIYGLLYFSIVPLSLDDIVEQLGISKASASTGTRYLHSWSAVRQVWVPGNRRDHYEAIVDVADLVRGSYGNFVKPRMRSTRHRLGLMGSNLEAELARGEITVDEYRICAERLKKLTRLQRKVENLLPIAERFLRAV